MKTIASNSAQKGIKLGGSNNHNTSTHSVKSLKQQLVSFKGGALSSRTPGPMENSGSKNNRNFIRDQTSSIRESSSSMLESRSNITESYTLSSELQRQSLQAQSSQKKRISFERNKKSQQHQAPMIPSFYEASTPSVISQDVAPLPKKFVNLIQNHENSQKHIDSDTSNGSQQLVFAPKTQEFKLLVKENQNLKTQNMKLMKQVTEIRSKLPQIDIDEKQKNILKRNLIQLNQKLITAQCQLSKLELSQKKKSSQYEQLLRSSKIIEQKNKTFEHENAMMSKQIENLKKNSTNLSKLLNDSRLKCMNLEKEKNTINASLNEESRKLMNANEEKRLLQIQLDNLQKIKQLVKELKNCDNDKKDVIQSHIAYEVRIIEMNTQLTKNQQMHESQLKKEKIYQEQMAKEFQNYCSDIASKVKDILGQKNKLQNELAEAKAETQKIRKEMFAGYQDIIISLKNQILELKEQNITLSENSDSKIMIVKLQNDVKILKNKNVDLLEKINEFQVYIERLRQEKKEEKDEFENLKKSHHKRALSQFSSETSIKYQFQNGSNQLESIIRNYEERGIDLNERLYEKQQNEQKIKEKLEKLVIQNEQLKQEIILLNRKQKSILGNTQNQLDSFKMQMKNETDSLKSKIQSLDNALKRKNREIKEKDDFITNYLIQRVKGEQGVEKILTEINQYFTTD